MTIEIPSHKLVGMTAQDLSDAFASARATLAVRDAKSAAGQAAARAEIVVLKVNLRSEGGK